MKPQYLDAGISERRSLYIKQIDTTYLDKPFHFHPNCELVYIEEGYGKRVIGDNVSNFNDGDLVLMGPNLPHIWMNDLAYYNGNRALRAKATVIYFSPDLLENMLAPMELRPFQALVNRAKRGLMIKGKSKEIIRQKLNGITDQDGLAKVAAFLSILDILTQTKETKYLCGEKPTNFYSDKDTSRINSVYRYLMQNFNRNILLEEVSDIINMAPTAFCRFFKEHTGKTFTLFLNELRIQHACDLLQHSDKTISEICYESGYNNLTNFNKFFKHIVRKTPTAFRSEETFPQPQF